LSREQRSRQQRIALLLEVSEERGQEATRALAHRRQLLDEAGMRLEELLGYRAACGRGDVAQAGGLAVGLQDYWRFLSRLNAAIAEQRERIEQQRLAVEQSLERWRQAQRQVAALEKLLGRIRASEDRTRERRDQRVLDDRRPSDRLILALEEA
jgi:flagellar export protein FliJ